MPSLEVLNERTIESISYEYANSINPWVVGFSGGKDSSALLKLTFQALAREKRARKPVTVVYCDTGVEIPVVRALVRRTLVGVRAEASSLGIPLFVKVVSPPLEHRYFVKVIGRGYPPPTNKFRWCTDKLRIKPIAKFLEKSTDNSAVVLLGVRRGESTERDRTIAKHRTKHPLYLRQAGSSKSVIFGPLIDYATEDIWETLARPGLPNSIDAQKLATLYRRASGECPIIRDPNSSACGQGRFGCWTCTVVRKDRALANLVFDDGFSQLAPLLQFRDWLIRIRDEPEYRCRWRRNGQRGMGPLTLQARKEILTQLVEAQTRSKYRLIGQTEIAAIKKLWNRDKQDPLYRE